MDNPLHDPDPDPGTAAVRYRAPALDRGLDIVEVLARQAGGLSRAELVRELGVSPSQIYRVLERLVARGYIQRVEGGDRYALSMKLFLLATCHPPIRRLTALAQPMMDSFARDMRQSCHLVMPQHGVGIVVAQASPVTHWEFRARIGAPMDLLATGSGITLLACQHPARLAETLGQWGVAEAAAALEALAPEFARIRDAGFRVAPSGQVAGVTDLTVPVLGPAGDAVAALTCAFVVAPDEAAGARRAATLARLVALGRALSLHAAG